MTFVPSAVFGVWLSGLFSLAATGGGIAALLVWYDRARTTAGIDFSESPALLAVGIVLVVWALAGRFLVRLLFALVHAFRGRTRRTDEDHGKPENERGGVTHRIDRPDGSTLRAEVYGPEDGIPLVLTHGWGLNSTVWHYAKQQLSRSFRLIVWDLPGLGFSTKPGNRDYRLENLALDLDAVTRLARGKPAILAGHSIGGMITLTYCRLFPEKLGKEVAGIALIHTTSEKPTRTTLLSGVVRALEKPFIVPAQYLTIALSPLVRLMNFLGYLNGTLHIMTALAGFGGTETWRQVEFITRFQIKASPAVTARGMLAMLAYDATDVLPTIRIPALIIPGNRDPVCRPEASERMEESIPNAEWKPLEPAKHMGYVEHNRTFSNVLAAFARSCVPPVTGTM